MRLTVHYRTDACPGKDFQTQGITGSFEALDDWTLFELVAHYVDYRTQASPSLDDLLPVTDFQLFKGCVMTSDGVSPTTLGGTACRK